MKTLRQINPLHPLEGMFDGAKRGFPGQNGGKSASTSETRASARGTRAHRFSGFPLRCLALVVCLGAMPAAADGISEPHTTFYGKVLGTGSEQPFLIDEGELSWTIRRSDGESVTLTSSLFPYNDNTFSYRMHVPHSAFALGLDSDPDAVPMPPVPQVHLHEAILVDGLPAALLGPAGSAFTTDQLLRTATYRLDLGLDRRAVDTDGDGIPDWWEDLHGLDKQDPTDAQGDLSGDGILAIDAYLRGLDPAVDHHAPTLLTQEQIVYPAGSTAILLDAFDLDSPPEALRYTLTSLPLAGALILRNATADPENPDAELAPGGQFTQADLMRGRVVYKQDDSGGDPGYFGVELRDENSEHPDGGGLVRLLPYEPGAYVPENLTDLERARLDNHFRALQGLVVMDAAGLPSGTVLSAPSAGLVADDLDVYLSDYGNDRRYALSGGGEGARLNGGHRSDVLTMHATDGFLAGGGGADRFLFHAFETGLVTVADFAPEEGDVMDLSRLPSAPDGYVHNFLQFFAVEDGVELRIDLDGDGAGFNDLAIALPGLSETDADLYAWIENGNLRVGTLRLEPEIRVEATLPTAARSGPTAGCFTLTRRGSLEGDLEVNILMGGTAQNNVDYQYVPSTLTIPGGAREVQVEIMPYASDDQSTKEATLTLLAGEGYRTAEPQAATVVIEPVKMVVEVAALFPLAVKNDSSGVFEIRRRHVLGTSVYITLEIGGRAVRGTDYRLIAHDATLILTQGGGILGMKADQETVLIQVEPLETAGLSEGARTVDLTVLAHEDYLVRAGAGFAQVALIERMDSFDAWREREFPGDEADAGSFARSDSGGTGITHFQRYAFGLDPHEPDAGGLPHPLRLGNRLVVTFRRPLGLTDVTYNVTGMTNLLDRVGSRVEMTEIPAPDGSRDPEQVYFQVEAGAAGAPAAFGSVEATLEP